MSTFGGYMPEFPDIRVDYFCQIPGRTSPLAYFLSHVHSDHLVGLDNDRVKLPFVYCSAATKEILIRLEKRRDRLNLAQGILEKEERTYKHLKNVLKPVPLDTPTLIELAPKNEVRVTLFDANHCTGAVMFLFERENTAVLYTGDIRSEPWFVNNLTRNPFLIEYTSGMKTLDCIYLDTSNIGPMEFPTKAEGLKELIGKVRKYPPNTKFHFAAWTFGYEEVWAALSRTLDSQIHVDKYKIKLYESLRQEGSNGQLRFLAPEGPVLVGCVVGNSPKQGCLTIDESVRIHSCEKGMGFSLYGEEDVVLIRPIISRLPSGVEVEEIGIGGGWGDLVPRYEVTMDFDDVKELLETVFAETDEPIVEDIRRMLLAELSSTAGAISLDSISSLSDQISLKDLGESLLRKLAHKSSKALEEKDLHASRDDLLKVITFPYSRHSSYPELCHLVEIFKPKDVYPCTVDEENWNEGVSMEELFGDHCSASVFRHDKEMRQMMAIIVAEMKMSSQQTQTTVESKYSPMPSHHVEELTLTAAKHENRSRSSTPIPPQKSLTSTSGKLWSEEILTSSPAPPSQIDVASISQTPGSIATKSDSNSSSQASRRRTATEIISPPPLKRIRLSQGSQIDGPSSSKPTSTSAAVGEQLGLESIDKPNEDSIDLELPLTTLMEKLDTIPTLCEKAMTALMNLQNGDLEVETYISQELPNLKSINTRIDQLVSPSVLSALRMTMLSFSRETLDILSEFQSSFEGTSGVHIDVNTYFCRQFSPLQYLTQEFKQVTSYLAQPLSQRKPWDSTKSLDSMSKIFQSKANKDGDIVGHGDIFTLMYDNELAKDDGIEDGNDDHTPNHSSSLIAAGEINCGSENPPFHDPIDDITRCGDCGHEIWLDQAERFEWTPGFCTGCGAGPTPFYENADFPGALPRIFEEEDDGSEVYSQDARILIGNTHLDYQSSAYDTQDEDSQLHEEYEINSFIDDDEPDTDSNSESHTSNHESEVDYKAAFQNLQKDFNELENVYFALVDEYSQFKYDMLGTTEEEDDDEDDGEGEDVLINEYGAHVVDVLVAQGDHVVTDVVISSFRGEDSQNFGEGGNVDVDVGERERGGDGDDGDGDDDSAGENVDGASTVARSYTLSGLRGVSVEL